jgi:predicted nucleic acid-binding protein
LSRGSHRIQNYYSTSILKEIIISTCKKKEELFAIFSKTPMTNENLKEHLEERNPVVPNSSL